MAAAHFTTAATELHSHSYSRDTTIHIVTRSCWCYSGEGQDNCAIKLLLIASIFSDVLCDVILVHCFWTQSSAAVAERSCFCTGYRNTTKPALELQRSIGFHNHGACVLNVETVIVKTDGSFAALSRSQHRCETRAFVTS